MDMYDRKIRRKPKQIGTDYPREGITVALSALALLFLFASDAKSSNPTKKGQMLKFTYFSIGLDRSREKNLSGEATGQVCSRHQRAQPDKMHAFSVYWIWLRGFASYVTMKMMV